LDYEHFYEDPETPQYGTTSTGGRKTVGKEIRGTLQRSEKSR
jgi:hypothetical protein